MGGTLLLADDSITIQKVVELTFAETEHSVVAVGNGRDLLARLDQVKPDVVLCDVVMPDLNGYDICQRIKSEPATLHIPVVLLTGTFEPFDRDRALAAGCDAIVTKPFEAKELVATVEELLERSRAIAETPVDDLGAAPGDLGLPDGVQAIDFTTTGFDRMVAPPPAPELAPADGIEMTTSSFQSQVSPPAPPPPPELADDSGAALAPAARVAPPGPGGEGAEELAVPLAEDQTTPSGPVPTAEQRKAAALALLEEVETRTEAPAPPEPGGAFEFAEPAAEAAPPPASPDAGVSADAAAARAAGPVSARELTQDEVDRIARRVLELAEPLIERIAWEVIPDMAEMMVRQRIRELEEAAEDEN